MWSEAGLNWSDFLPENEDVNKFVTDKVCLLDTKNITENIKE